MNEKTNEMAVMPKEKENTRYSHKRNFKKNFVKGKNEEKIERVQKTDKPEMIEKTDKFSKSYKAEKNKKTNNDENTEKNQEMEKTSRTRVRKNSTAHSSKRDYNKPSKNNKYNLGFKKSNVKIIAIGGLDEIGKNITIIEYENEMILVDCGLEFPDDDMLGVDLVIPDFTYIIKNKEKVKGLFITHGHEDHIGSIPYLLQQINIPIYATRLTAKLIEHKLDEHHLLSQAKINVVEQGQTINAGKMQVEFIRSSHSIPDACMLAIHTPQGVNRWPNDGLRKTCRAWK